jgi:predicted RNase H-like HicB family nuclease
MTKYEIIIYWSKDDKAFGVWLASTVAGFVISIS